MSRSKPPRRKYRGAQNSAAERMAMIRRFGTPAESSLLLSVTPDVADNPVARDIERGQIIKSGEDLELMLLAAQDGAHLPELLYDCVQFLALAALAAEGYETEEFVPALLSGAMDALTEMGQAGQIWRAEHRALVAEAVSVAAPVFAALPPADRNRAAWQLRQMDRQAEIDARAAA